MPERSTCSTLSTSPTRSSAGGLRATRFTIRDRDRALMTIGFADLLTSDPYTLMVSQATTEAVLLRRLTDLGVPVHRPTRLIGLTQTDALATATFADGATIAANWVVGVDGMRAPSANTPASRLAARLTPSPSSWPTSPRNLAPPGRGDPLLLPRRDARSRPTA